MEAALGKGRSLGVQDNRKRLRALMAHKALHEGFVRPLARQPSQALPLAYNSILSRPHRLQPRINSRALGLGRSFHVAAARCRAHRGEGTDAPLTDLDVEVASDVCVFCWRCFPAAPVLSCWCAPQAQLYPSPFFEAFLRSFILGLGFGALFEVLNVGSKVSL